MTTLTGEAIVTSDFSTFSRGLLSINPEGDGVTSYPEYCSFTAVSGLTVTGVTRGLSAKSNSVVAANKRFHPAGTPVIISFGAHNIEDFITYINAQVASITVGTSTSVLGTAGESLTVGNLVYLKNDGKWWKTDADTLATIDSVQLGICQSTTSADATITSGVLLQGLDTNQTGLVAGTEYYISNTAGGISSSAGTNSKKIGVARTTTALYFDPLYAGLPSEGEKAALPGDSSTSPSATNPFVTKYSTRFGVRTKTAGATINGATLPVPVYQSKADNEFYACDANDTNAMKFIGFAISNGTDGNNIDIQFNGVVSGFTGLSEGEKYYVQDTVGTIGTTIGTYEILVGIAISETELLIQRGRRRAAGNTGSLGTASGSTVVTCGFRPSVVRLQGLNYRNQTTDSSSYMNAVYTNGVMSATVMTLGHSGSATVNTSAVLYAAGSTSDFMTFTITSITDTGFTITWTETGTYIADGDGVLWEAEGEL